MALHAPTIVEQRKRNHSPRTSILATLKKPHVIRAWRPQSSVASLRIERPMTRSELIAVLARRFPNLVAKDAEIAVSAFHAIGACDSSPQRARP
jgi:hypothetical protein